MPQTQSNISVALCTYNGERYIQAQLDSLASQTLLPFEAVICDDGSQDSTLEIVERFASNASFPVRIHRNAANLGYTKNFEKAISLCGGAFIALCDQDDIWYPNKLSTQVAILKEDENCGGVFTNGDLIWPDGMKEARSLWQSFRFTPQQQERFAQGFVTERLLQGNVVTGMTLLFRASLRNLLLPIPRTWIHDAWLAWMIALHSKLVACPEHLVAYRLHSSQQVGVPLTPFRKFQWVCRNGLGSYFDRAREKSLRDYRDIEAQFTVLLDYLKNFDSELPPNVASDLIVKIKDKLRHAHAASKALSSPRRLRVRPILENLPLYLKHSQLPMRAIFRDMVI